ncbi:MAG: hypothetical protein FRX48_00376 [Lasallia pustulata]|uniref:Uncharacterized protein n=1 Tax=Lasallia pustulata TaxID=136370 RepID=A0A5M8Q3L1_9LECA|nr:MAG: hypothetical protein FRX48_00376 [Lasallia pustulata]
MADAAKDMQRTFPMCEEGLRAKVYGDGASFGRKEFDVLLGDYASIHQPSIKAVTDVPRALFVDELTKAYPDAKVILTNRDVDKWMGSMQDAGEIVGLAILAYSCAIRPHHR